MESPSPPRAPPQSLGSGDTGGVGVNGHAPGPSSPLPVPSRVARGGDRLPVPGLPPSSCTVPYPYRPDGPGGTPGSGATEGTGRNVTDPSVRVPTVDREW